MKVNFVNGYNASFKARLSPTLNKTIKNCYRQIFATGDSRDIMQAKSDLVDISNFGKHYYGENRPIILVGRDKGKSSRILAVDVFAAKDKKSKVGVYDKKEIDLNPLKFISSLKNDLKTYGKATDVYENDAKYESEKLMEELFPSPDMLL